MAYNKSQKLQDNIAAIKLVLQLSKDGRTANDDERAVLRQYSGFGGLKFILNPAASDEDKRHWKISDQQYFRPVRELYAIIHEYASDEKEERAIVDSVKRSVNTAFYTPGAVIDAIASVFKERGVEVRTMLDPSAGIGKFGDSFKQAYDGDIKVSAFEKDVLTGKILSALNPNDQVTVDGFETIPAKTQGTFDLATSNIPFGDIRVMDDEYRRSKNDARRYSVSTIHNYFFLKALDQVREGGFVAFITSRGFMDSPSNNPIRQEIAKNARLVGAFRLPDGMFRDEAGTDVGSDLVVLQKVSGYDMSLDPETQAFCETSKGFKAMSGDDYTDITMNTFWWQSMMTPDAEVSVSTNMMRGTDPYGKPTLVFTHDGGMDGISKQLKEYFSRDFHREYIDYYQEHAPKIEVAVVEQQTEEQTNDDAKALEVIQSNIRRIVNDLPSRLIDKFYGSIPYVALKDNFFLRSNRNYRQIFVEDNLGQSDPNHRQWMYHDQDLPLDLAKEMEKVIVELDKTLRQEMAAQQAAKKRESSKPQAQSAPVQLDLFAMWDEIDAGNGPFQEELQAQEAERTAQEAARREAERKRLEPREWVGDYKEWYRDGTVVVEPNTHYVGVLTGNIFNPLANLTADQTGRLRQYVLIRDAYHELYNTEAELREEQPDLREVLNRHYDNFFLQYGCLNERRNARVIMMDALGRDGLTLENEGENRGFVKADIFERPVSFISYEITHVDNPEEALFASLNLYGRVNLEYMAGLTGHKQEEIPGLLKGQIYYMPDGSYEIASKALSGNVYEKLEYVSEALDMIKGQEPGDDLDANIIPALEETKAALQAVIPEQIAFDDIGLQFGERWIPTEYYEEYIGKLFNTKMEIHYAEHIDEYSLKAEDRLNLKIREEFCVRGEYKDYDGMALLAHAFHNTTPDIQKCVGYDENGDDLKGPDMEKIQLANTKIEEIRDGFTEYLTNFPKEKRDELQEMYNRKFNCFVKAKYDGSYQTFPGIDLKALASPKFNIKNIYKSQKDCVKMILENGGGICDHEVGTGKSLIMCMAAHEMHRLGIANKPMIIAMKANVAEIAATYQAAFPDDKILYASEKDFSPANRVQFFSRIKNNDYACVIMSHDQFGKIPQAMEVQQQILQDEIRDIDEALDVIRQQGGNISGRMLTGLEKRKENMEVKLLELQSDMANRKDDFVDFGRMGIDHIFIDESHQFKNLMFTTRHQRVSGLGNPSGSQKALNLLYAIRTIQNRTGKDLGATFLSGTTISNSLTELYLLFKYLRPEAMAKQGIHSFDAWAAVYAKKTSDYEFSVTNAVVQKERFRYFVKVPELATFYNENTDYRTGEDVGLDRPNMNVILHDIEPTADQKDFNERLVQFAQTGDGELIFRAPLNDREMKGKMLIATDASRKASLDMRLISPELFGDDPNNKASHCARLVSEYYQKFNEQKGTQFVFSDLSTYKPGVWNVFQEIKDKLVNDYGIPAHEIRFIQEAKNQKQREQIIKGMNDGTIRVLFGSTSTLGTGVNAQQRAVAVHHIDIPWRPSDLEQRNGRARRTGNWVAKEFAGNNVDIIIYAVKRTLDSYKFNLLQNKQLFITQLKTNQLGTRVIDEGAMDEENGMNFVEYVAILSGNDDLLQKAKLEKKIMALESERKTYMQARRDTEWRLENAREKLGKNEVVINGMTEDYERYQSQVKQGEDGAPLPGLVLNNVSEFTADGSYNIEEMGAALQDAGRTVGNKDRQIGTVYGFPLIVDTIYMYDEKLRKEVYAGNKFYVKGNYLYEYNNGKLAMSKDNRLGAVRYGVNALEKIPGVIAQYQERNEKLRADIAEYERIAGKPWGKEDELKGLKKEMEALDAKIRESLDETTKNMPKVEEKPYKFSKEGRYHKVLFARDAYPFVSISEMREFADTGSWRNSGYVRCGNWDGDVMVSEPEVEGEFTLRQKAEEFIAKVEETNNERKNNLDWLIVKAKENTKGDKVHQDNEVIFAAREALQKQGVDWQNAQEPAKGAVPTQKELETDRLLTLANTKDAHTLPLSDDLWHRARLMLDNRGIDWHTGLPINDVSKYVLKWRNAGDNQLSLYAQGVITRGRVFHPGDASVLTAQELKQLDDAVASAKGTFKNDADRRDAYERLMILVDYLGEQMMQRGEQVQVHQSVGEALLPGAEFYQQYINKHFEGHSESAIIKLSNALVQISDEYTKMPDWYQRESILAQMRVQANRNLRANGFGGAKDIVELMMNHVMPQDQQRDLAKMRVYSAGQYGGTVMGEELRTLAHQLKEYGTAIATTSVVDKMVDIFDHIPEEDKKKMVLVPMPGASGSPAYMDNVVSELSERLGIQSVNHLFCSPHEPLYDLKKNGATYDHLPDIKFEMDGTLPAGTIVVLVDNVLDTGKTLSLAAKADFGDGVEVRAAVLAHTGNYQEHHPEMEVISISQLREEMRALRDQRKAEREAGYEAAIAALEVSQQGVDAAAVEEMKRLLTISWKAPFGGKVAKEQLNALGVDWKTGESIISNAADHVSFQFVAKDYVSTVTDSEKDMLSLVAMDLMSGNYLLGRRRPDGYREFMAEIGGAFAAVKTLSVTARQRDLLVALSGQYHEGYAELASQADVSEDVFTEALRRVDAERPAIVQDYSNSVLNLHLRDALIGRLREAGIKVNTNITDGQRVLDQVSEKQGVSATVGYSQQTIEEKIGPRLTTRNYETIRKINPFLGFLWSDKTPEFIDYREVFKVPTMDDYFVATKAEFVSVGAVPDLDINFAPEEIINFAEKDSWLSDIASKSESDVTWSDIERVVEDFICEHWMMSPEEVSSKDVFDILSVVNSQKFQQRQVKSLIAVEHENQRQWNDMVSSGRYEFQKSPRSYSEYLLDHETGDIYRFSNHWGRVASCLWSVDKQLGSEETSIYQIARCNISDFKPLYSERKAHNPAYGPFYADALQKTISNYETLLQSNVEITGAARQRIEKSLENYRHLQILFKENGYTESRYIVRPHQVDNNYSDQPKYFRNGNRQVYGFVYGDTIYIDSKIATAETPIHEYTHLWAEVLRQRNPQEWGNIVQMMKDTPELWNYVISQYPVLQTDDEIADEALAHFSGQRGVKRLQEFAADKDNADTILDKISAVLEKFWKSVSEFFGMHYSNKEEVADRILYDMINGVNPLDYRKIAPRTNIDDTSILEENPFIRVAADRQFFDNFFREEMEEQIKSKNFKDWFGDWDNDLSNASKVVDEQGRPLVVEHATNADFTEFDMSHIGENSKDNGIFGAGFYFGTKAPGWMQGAKNIMRVYLDIKHPFEITDDIVDMYSEIRDKMDSPAMRGLNVTGFNDHDEQVGILVDQIKAVDKMIVDGKHLELMAKDKELEYVHPDNRLKVWREHEIMRRSGLGSIALSWQSFISDQVGSYQFTAAAMQDGYDGVIVERGEGYKEYVVFEPSQIKSAMDNIGLFSKENNDIRYHTVPIDNSYLNSLALRQEVETLGKQGGKILAGYEDPNTFEYVFVGVAADNLARFHNSFGKLLYGDDISRPSEFRIPVRDKKEEGKFDILTANLLPKGYRLAIVTKERVQELLSKHEADIVVEEKPVQVKQRPFRVTSAVQLDLFADNVQQKQASVVRHFTPQDREAGGALVDHLQAMGITVHTDNRENRRILKAAGKDQSEAGKVRHFKTETGESYGFAYKGEIHLDLRKLNAELPLHEFAHLFCQAMQRINPDNWNHVVGLLKQDAETWDAVKRIYPELATDSEVAEEVIAQYSGKRGAEKLQAELERMTPKDANYGSRWGNIYQNVAKAIQDFWKHIGDSMNIEYSSKEDIADQILNDFAKNVNPVKKMERWLEERDKEYAVAVERGDTDKARELFNAAMQEHVGNGVTPFIAVDGYRGKMDRLARAVKSDGLNSVNLNAINEAADLMAPMVPDNAVLVPAPSHEGYATDMLLLANAIGVRTNSEVADVLKSAPRDSQYDHKINTGKPFTVEELGIHMEGELPEGKFPVVIDNVVNTGNTAEACVQALGGGLVLSLASATSQERHVASLKSASPIVYDKQGQLIPLSERFELKNKWLGRVMNYKPLDGAEQQPVMKEPDVIQGLEGYSIDDVKSYVKNSIDEILEDADLSDKITIKNITVVGSRSRGEAHEGSDLDILVEYEGNFREDALFDILHEEGLDLEGITIDINPINPHYSLTTEQWLARDAQWREEDRQKAVAKSGMNENVQSQNIRSMQTSVIKSNLQVLADRLLPGTQSRVRFLQPQDPDRPSAVGGEIYRRDDGIHVFRENRDVPLSSLDDRNELSDLYRSLLEYSIAERIGNGNGMNFPDSPNVDGYEISTAAVVDGNLRVMGTRDGDQANNSSYITMEGLEDLLDIIDKRVAEVENIRDFDAVALHESNYQAFALAASVLKSKVNESNTLYDSIIAIGDMPPTVEHLEEWASEQMDALRRGDADSVRVNELSNGKYRKFLSAVSAYLPEEDVKRLIDGIAAQRNTYSENHIIDQYDKVISHYQVHSPEGALADDVVSLLAAKDGVALMNWVRDSHDYDPSEPLQLLKTMLSTKSISQADQITAVIQERDLQEDHRAQVERSLPKTPIEQSFAFVMGYYINNVSKMSEDEKALFKRLDCAHSVDAYQRWASDVRIGGALQGLSDMPEAVRSDVQKLASQIIEINDDVLKNEVIAALDGIGIVNQFRKDVLAQQYDALKAKYPDETILFRNGKGCFSAYGADVDAIQCQTGWFGQTVGEKGQQFRWMNISHDGYNVLADKDMNLRVVTPVVSIRPLSALFEDKMGIALQTIDYGISLGGEKPVSIDTDGSLVISDKDLDFKVKTLDFHSTGLTAISEEGKEMVIRDIPKNYYHPQGTLVVADYINGHRQTIEHSLEASRPVSAEIQAKQTQLLASYKDVKAAHENEAVLFRQKGFFEAFGPDADHVAEKFGVPVYERNINGENVHFAMLSTERYASAQEDGVDLDLFIVKAQIDESRRDIRSTLSLNEQINVEHGRTKLGVSVMPIGDEGRYEIAIFDPDTKLLYDDAMELSKEDAEKFRSLEGMEHLSERSDLEMALADKYFSKDLEMSDARSQVTKTYDNMGMSYTPLMLLQTIDFKPNQTAEVEHYNAVSVDPPYIMLYETMGDAEKSMSPRMLTDLPLDLQQSVLEQLKGGMFNEMQQELLEAEIDKGRQELQFSKIDDVEHRPISSVNVTILNIPEQRISVALNGYDGSVHELDVTGGVIQGGVLTFADGNTTDLDYMIGTTLESQLGKTLAGQIESMDMSDTVEHPIIDNGASIWDFYAEQIGLGLDSELRDKLNGLIPESGNRLVLNVPISTTLLGKEFGERNIVGFANNNGYFSAQTDKGESADIDRLVISGLVASHKPIDGQHYTCEVAEHFEQPQEQHINIDDQLEHVGQLTKELGLEYVPFSIRLPITVPADTEVDWREEDKVFTEVMCNGDNVTIYQNHQDSYDDNHGVDLYDLPKDLQKEVLDLMEEKLTDGDRQMTVYVDTAQVPEYAVGSIVNGDNTGLTDESIEMVREFTSQYPNHFFSVRDNSTSFNSCPAFGKATDCVDVDIVRIATPKQLRQEVVDKQTEKLQERFNDFVKEHGEEPLYAEVFVRYKDDPKNDKIERIKLSEDIDPKTDYKIFFNVNGFEGLKNLMKVDNGEDFEIFDIEDTIFYDKSLFQTEELPYRISYGDDPTGVIEGDVHVQFTKELAYVSFEDFKHYAEDLGGSVRMMNNERWADFFRQDDAEKFANTVVDVNVSRMEAARAGAKEQPKVIESQDRDTVLAEVTEKISQTENKEYSPDDVAILKEAAIAHIEKYNSDYYQAKGVDIKGMIESSEVTDRHSLSAAVASAVFDIHSEALGRESGILERLLPYDMDRVNETFLQSRDVSAAAEAILDLRQNNLKDALDTKVAEVNTTLTEFNRLSQAADPSFTLHSHVEKYALEQQSENEFALTDPVERKFATSWMGARELLAYLANLLQKMFEKFPELKPSHEDKTEESPEQHVDAEEQGHAEKSDGQKKTSKWDNLDYTKYVLPEGADVTHKRWKFIKPKDGEQYGKYHIMCDFKGKHYEREMYGNDIKAFFEKDETGQRTNRVTLDQLVAKYFGKQFAEAMSIGSVQEAEHVLAEQKDAKDQAVVDKEEQAQQQVDKENQAALHEAAEEKKAAEEAAKKKAEEEKKAEKKEKVPTLILQSSLLVGALLAAKENGGVWLNKDGKAAPVLHQPGTPIVSAFNGLMMALHSDAHGYKSNDYTTFNAAKSDGYHVKGGESGLPFNWYKWDKYVNRFNANEVIDKAAYDALAPEEKELYKVQRIKEERSIFNIDQTTMPETLSLVYQHKLEKQDTESVYRSALDIPECAPDVLKQFNDFKDLHPDTLLLFRCGDFYEVYEEDAHKASEILGISVSDEVDAKDGKKYARAGISHHALDIYLPKLIRSGLRVAICDQIGSAVDSKRRIAAEGILFKSESLVSALLKQERVFSQPFFDTGYDNKDDMLRFADSRQLPLGNEVTTALQRVNDIFRAAAAYTGGESRLNRVAYSTMLPGDTEKYDRLVSELAAGVLMSRAGLPATLSKESMALVPYWERELKESPKLMESVERDVNNAVEVLEKIKAGETVDYAAIRGEKSFDAVRPKLYTIANELATIPNADTKVVVVVKDQQNKSAAVILPAGASLEVNNEITGLNKNRFLIALRKQGFENVQFYNAGGALGLNQSNEFFADKTVEVAKLKQYDLQVVENIDLSEEIERSLKVDLQQVQVTFDDNKHPLLYVKPVDGESFTVYPEPSDVKLFFDNVRSPEFDSIRENLGQKYYGLVVRHPDLKTDVLMPKVSSDLDLSRISKVNITKDRFKPESTIIFATIDGQQQKPIELSQIEAQRYWLVDDKNLYKLLVAAQKFEEQLHVDNGQSEGGQGQFHDSHEGSGVDSSSPSAEVSAEEDKQERKGGIRM